MQTDEEGRPVTFVLNEQRFRLLCIEQHWEVDTDWWSDDGRVWRRYVAATTLEGVVVVLFTMCCGRGGIWRGCMTERHGARRRSLAAKVRYTLFNFTMAHH